VSRLSSRGFLCLIFGVFLSVAGCRATRSEYKPADPKANRVAVLLDGRVSEVKAEAFYSLIDDMNQKGGALTVVTLCGGVGHSVHYSENTPLDEEYESILSSRARSVESTKERIAELLNGEEKVCSVDDPIWRSVFKLHVFGVEPFLEPRGTSIVVIWAGRWPQSMSVLAAMTESVSTGWKRSISTWFRRLRWQGFLPVMGT
jgi:hypothetical protein